MSNDNKNSDEVDKAAIDDNIDRTVDKAALRKVRNLVDELEAEDSLWQRQQKWIMLGGAAVAIAALVWVTTSKQKDTAADARMACELLEWQKRVAVLSAEMKGRNPGITHVELQRQIESYRKQMQDGANKACAPR